MRHPLLTAAILVFSALIAKAQNASNPYFIDSNNHSISLNVTKNYLKRSVAVSGLVDMYKKSNCVDYYDYNLTEAPKEAAAFEKFITDSQPKVIQGVGLWADDQYQLKRDCDVFFKNCREAANTIHNLQGCTDIILGASLDEVISPYINSVTYQIEIPQGLAGEYNYYLNQVNQAHSDYGFPSTLPFSGQLYFESSDISSGKHLETNALWVDMTKDMTQLWYFYLAKNYIDNGFEMLRLGQVTITAANDINYAKTFQLIQVIRQYAKTHARRNIVLFDQQGQPISTLIGNTRIYLFDVCGLPTRLHSRKAVTAGSGLDMNGAPTSGQDYEAVISTGDVGKGPEWTQCNLNSNGMTTYWESPIDKLPCYAEFDNTGEEETFATTNPNGHAPAPNIMYNGKWDTNYGFPWGWDECSWFYNQSEAYERQILVYLFNQVSCMSDGNAAFCMPLRRNYHYYDNNNLKKGVFNLYYNNGQDFRNLGSTIKSIWDSYSPSSITNEFNSWPTELPSASYSQSGLSGDGVIKAATQTINLNNDDYSDIVTKDQDAQALIFYTLSSSSNPTEISRLQLDSNGGASPSYLSKMTIGDFNGDGYDDFILTADKTYGEYYTTYVVYLNDKSGRFSPGVTSYDGPSWGERIYVGDFNGDKYDDLLATANKSVLKDNSWAGYRVYLNQQAQMATQPNTYQFNLVSNSESSFPSWGERLFIGDYNGDGKADFLVTSDYSTNPNYVTKGYKIYHSQIGSASTALFELVNISNGANGLKEDYPSWGENIYPCDLNGDGHTDLLTTAATQFGISWPGYIAYIANEKGDHFAFATESSDNTIIYGLNTTTKVGNPRKSKQVLVSYYAPDDLLILNSFDYKCQPMTFANSRMGRNFVTTQNAVSTESVLNQPTSVEISPNPSNHYFDITSPFAIGSYYITDMSGKLMQSASIPGANHFSIDAEKLKGGIYILHLNTATGPVNTKLVKID